LRQILAAESRGPYYRWSPPKNRRRSASLCENWTEAWGDSFNQSMFENVHALGETTAFQDELSGSPAHFNGFGAGLKEENGASGQILRSFRHRIMDTVRAADPLFSH